MKLEKTLLIFALFLIIQPNIYCEVKSVDSLKNLASKSSGIRKIDLLIEIASSFRNIDNNQQLTYSGQAITEARKINYLSGIARALNQHGYALNEMNKFDESKSNLFEAKKIFSQLSADEDLANSYHYIGKNYDYRGQADSAIFYYQKSLALFSSLNSDLNIAQLEMNLGIQMWNRGQFKSALGYFQRALKIRTKLNDIESIGNSKNSIGSVYYRLGDFSSAMKFFRESLVMRQSSKDTLGMVISFNNIGSVYQKLESFDIAEKYYNSALIFSDKKNYKFGKALTLYNIGLLYLDKKDNGNSLKYLNNSYSIAKSILSQNLRTMILNYKGRNYEKMKDFGNAEMYYKWALSIAKQTKDKFVESLLLQALSRIYVETNRIKEAKEILDNGNDFAQKNDINELLKDNYYLYYKIFLKKNENLKALEYFKLYSEKKDSLLFKSGNSLANILLKFELEQSDKEKELLRREKTIVEKEKNYQTVLKNFFIIATVLVLLVGVLLLVLYRNQIKTQKIIEMQKADLEKLNEQLKELNKQKDKLFTIIAHDLKSPFQALLGHSDLLNNEIDSLSKNQIKECGENINESAKKIFNLILTLLDWARQQLGKFSYSPEIFNVSELMNEVHLLYSNLLESKKITLINSYSVDIYVYADRQMINSVIRNLFSNAIKFTKVGGHIEIKIEDKIDFVEFCILDNGVGMEESIVNNIFNVDFVSSKIGTQNEVGTGLGLNLSKDFIEKNSGKIWVESKIGEGTKFHFTLPKNPK